MLSFFFIVTATTEIYTYIHPLSLHAALPISRSQHPRSPHPREAEEHRPAWPRSHTTAATARLSPAIAWAARPVPICCSIATIPRSEEHTSELQSLMRISYAVFCLKKKNNNTNTKPQSQ